MIEGCVLRVVMGWPLYACVPLVVHVTVSWCCDRLCVMHCLFVIVVGCSCHCAMLTAFVCHYVSPASLVWFWHSVIFLIFFCFTLSLWWVVTDCYAVCHSLEYTQYCDKYDRLFHYTCHGHVLCVTSLFVTDAGWSVIANLSSTATTHSISDVYSTGYTHFRIVACNSVGCSWGVDQSEGEPERAVSERLIDRMFDKGKWSRIDMWL